MARLVHLQPGADLDGFRRAVRGLIADRVEPSDVVFTSDAGGDLFDAPAPVTAEPLMMPRDVSSLIERVVCHRDPERYALLYRLIWRVLNGERLLLEVASDPLVHRLAMMHKAVRRDLHKMHAFVRFREAGLDGGERFVAFFEPDHFILEAAAPFFVERFGALTWSILTPIGSLHWDRQALHLGPPATASDAPSHDAFEAGWIGYYESAFNPARLNTGAMRAEMPQKYWRNLPEAVSIPGLVRTASLRVQGMMDKDATMPAKRNPDKAVTARLDAPPRSLEELNRIIAHSEPLVPGATRAVLGEGPAPAAIAFVGEQPGDQEDLEGRPFIGPAGQMLRRAMAEAGLVPEASYLTNAVKHFKFEQRGKRRLHQSPTAGEVKHYRWWLEEELGFVAPRLVVALGATALLALTGKALPVGRNRGEMRLGERPGFVTVHPAYLLRLPDEQARREAWLAFVEDMKRIRVLAEAA